MTKHQELECRKDSNMTKADQTIDSIIESAVRWNSEDADNPDTPPQDWQEVIPLMKAAPALLETLEYFVKWAVTHNLHLAELTDGRIAEVPMVVIARSAIAKTKAAQPTK